ncbi:MAG: hypothetical protein ACFB5Z_17310 [Elainellaceae cyanobacterium]
MSDSITLKEKPLIPWQQLKNAYLSVSTYGDLSADISQRRQIKLALKERRNLCRHDWCRTLWPDIYSAKILAFLYDRIPKYSGLPAGKLRPSDDLESDLSWTHICEFDWDTGLCDDFQAAFDYDISDHLLGAQLYTLEDLVICLHQQAAS